MPELKSKTQSAFTDWIAGCERMFDLYECADIDVGRRTNFAIMFIKTEHDWNLRDAVSALTRRQSRLPALLWDEMIQIVQDTIQNPAVRRAELAVQYHGAAIRDN